MKNIKQSNVVGVCKFEVAIFGLHAFTQSQCELIGSKSV